MFNCLVDYLGFHPIIVFLVEVPQELNTRDWFGDQWKTRSGLGDILNVKQTWDSRDGVSLVANMVRGLSRF